MPIKITLRFKQSFSWNLLGSSAYEIIKVVLSWFLFTTLMEPAYARLGIIFSLIYFTARVADFGNAYALSPYLVQIQKSKALFRKIIVQKFFLPQLPIIACALAGLALYAVEHGLFHSPTCLVIVLAIVLLETYRLFFRYYLHGSFAHRRVVCIELATYVSFVTFIILSRSWITVTAILYAHLIESCAATLLLGGLFYARYKGLPDNIDISHSSTTGIFRAKLFIYMSRVGREFSSNNFLTPVVSNLFDSHITSVFYVVGTTVSAISAIIRNTFLYSGNAVLALTKNSATAQQRMFAILTRKLSRLVLPLYVTLLMQLPLLFRVGQQHWQGADWLITFILFVIMVTIDLWANLYEQYYIVREAGHIFFAMRVIEVTLFVLLPVFDHNETLMITFFYLVGIKACCLLLIALHAYFQWHIKPSGDYNRTILLLTVGANLAAAVIWR